MGGITLEAAVEMIRSLGVELSGRMKAELCEISVEHAALALTALEQAELHLRLASLHQQKEDNG
jgi:hypothetical protein